MPRPVAPFAVTIRSAVVSERELFGVVPQTSFVFIEGSRPGVVLVDHEHVVGLVVRTDEHVDRVAVSALGADDLAVVRGQRRRPRAVRAHAAARGSPRVLDVEPQALEGPALVDRLQHAVPLSAANDRRCGGTAWSRRISPTFWQNSRSTGARPMPLLKSNGAYGSPNTLIAVQIELSLSATIRPSAYGIGQPLPVPP